MARSTVEEYIIDKARGKLVINHMVFSSLDERLKGGAKVHFDPSTFGANCQESPKRLSHQNVVWLELSLCILYTFEVVYR